MNENQGRVTIAPEVLVTIARLTSQSVEGVAQLCHQVGPGNADRICYTRGTHIIIPIRDY